MNYKFLIILLIFFSSCVEKAQKKNKKSETRDTLALSRIGNSSQDTAYKKKTGKNIFDSKELDSVIGYTYLYFHDYEDDTLSKGSLLKIIPNKEEYIWRYDQKPKVALTSNQISTLLSIINNPKHYDFGKAFCFYPRNCFTFYNKKKQIIGYYEICFECLQIESRPAFINSKSGRLTKEGNALLIDFCRGIGLHLFTGTGIH